MGIRKNIRDLTVSEKASFINAILALKNNNAAGNKYNDYVLMHGTISNVYTPSGSSRGAAHGGPSFFPWHRHYINLFERDLQRVSGNSDIAIPYWDFGEDASNPTASPMWATDFMGGNGDTSDSSYAVKNGPFRHGNWVVVNSSNRPVYYDGRFTGALKRRFGYDTPTIPTASQINYAIGINNYDTDPWLNTSSTSVRNRVEGYEPSPQMHNRIHRWVGQTLRTNLAPNDPIFWILHSTIDWLWARKQAVLGTRFYSPNTGGPSGHNLYDYMHPWGNVRPVDVLNYEDLGYTYDVLN